MKRGHWFEFGRLIVCAVCAFGVLAATASAVPAASHGVPAAKANDEKKNTIYAERKQLFEEVSRVTGIPWTYLAAIDQYERALSIANPRTRPPRQGLIGIHYSNVEWTGMANPNRQDTNPASIALFGGSGRDGSGDGLADLNNDLDVFSAMVSYLLRYGPSPNDLKTALKERYHSDKAITRIEQFATIYAAFQTLDLHDHAFPLPLSADYSYRSTYGASRSWGGFRIHEGTDLFAHYGVPVRSTCYGIVETMGWNPYGGWRIGLRDLNNVYHYYAHLSGYRKGLRQGDVVKPGQILGWVGSSGYGKPGTQGKFPPHLHFGLYRDNGKTEWSFDPYPYLKKWERGERSAKQKKR